jgi:hypothetical protein
MSIGDRQKKLVNEMLLMQQGGHLKKGQLMILRGKYRVIRETSTQK